MSQFKSAAAIIVACVGGFGLSASAATVPETETNGTAVNNTTGTAQLIPAAAFEVNASPEVFGTLLTATVTGRGGGDDIDMFSFSSPGGIAYFDIDHGATGFDTYLALFDATGTLLADNDDSFPTDPGSLSDLDAFLGTVTLPGAGNYFIVVASASNAALATFTGTLFTELQRPDGAYGGFAFGNANPGDSSFASTGAQVGADYTLHISIPAPASLFALAGIAAFPLRRRR